MTKIRIVQLSVLFVVFSLVASGQSTSKALAANQTGADSPSLGSCQSASTTPGFSIGSQTRGSVVTLCGKFVADQTASPKPKPSRSLRPKMPITQPRKTPEVQPVDSRQAQKLLHRKLAKQGETSFSPSQLVILATPGNLRPLKFFQVTVAHNRQFRTAYLLGRFVALRFTPIRIDLHFDAAAKVKSQNPKLFRAMVGFKSLGPHTIRGIVTYRSEYRLNGSKAWQAIDGQPQLAAIAARVLVSKQNQPSTLPAKNGKKPLLVANDCLENPLLLGCLN